LLTSKLRTLFFALCLLAYAGCTPAVRYTARGAGNSAPSVSKPSYRVAANWDYRKSYTIPQSSMASAASKYLGIRYRWGGMSRKGTDCSGLVCMIYHDVCRARLPHSSKKQRALGRLVTPSQAKCGDLVFFGTGHFGRVNHVGIYLGNGKFIHASTKLGVIYSDLDDAYYKKRFVEMRRIFG